MKEETKKIINELLEGIEEDSLRRGEVWSLDRFRANVGKIGVEILEEETEGKTKLISAVKAAGLQLIASIPIITPVITAFLEVITSEDLGNKMDKMLILQEKILHLQENTLHLQEKTLHLQEKTLHLQEKTLCVLEERLPKNPKG